MEARSATNRASLAARVACPGGIHPRAPFPAAASCSRATDETEPGEVVVRRTGRILDREPGFIRWTTGFTHQRLAQSRPYDRCDETDIPTGASNLNLSGG